ncbi:diguanylate cyclase [Aliikangiella sp. IMCC44632]
MLKLAFKLGVGLYFYLLGMSLAFAFENLPAKVHYLFQGDAPASFQVIKHTNQWQHSSDGWIKESYDQLNYWFGPQPKVVWLKIEPDSRQNSQYDWIELASSGMSDAILYVQKQPGIWGEISSEKALQTQPKTRFLSFQIEPEWRQHTIYLRTEASDKYHLQLNFHQNQSFINSQQLLNSIFFICYGILLVMVLYNAVIGVFLKDSLYFIYAAAIGFTLIYQVLAHGHIRLAFLPNWDNVNYLLNFLAMSSALAALIFLYRFAEFRLYAPSLAKFTRGFIIVFAIFTALSLLIPSNLALNLALLLAGPTPIFAIMGAAWVWYKGSYSAGIFLVSWLAYIIGGTLWVYYWFGIIPISPLVELPLAVGAALESILLSLALGYRIQSLQSERDTLSASHSHYKQISLIDPLTKLANRRAFDEFIQQLEIKQQEFSIILFDIDHFKKFNDTYGHPAGDDVLVSLGELLAQSIRHEDIAARMGGEEFSLIINSPDPDVAYNICERIRISFSEKVFDLDAAEVSCTLSAGVCKSNPKLTLAELISLTDKALYQAKHSGRNQTKIATVC